MKLKEKIIIEFKPIIIALIFIFIISPLLN